MKCLIDRTTPVYREIKNKEIYFIMTAADDEKSNFARTLEAFRGFTEDCLDGTVEKGIICGGGVWNAGEVKSTPAYDEAYLMGKNV